MGAGKSTQGKALSASLGFNFIDLDELIEKGEVKKIPMIFSEEGEMAFRKLESDYLRRLDPGMDMVVSVGGGTPCFHENMDWMNNHGLTVYLKLSAEALFTRLKRSSTVRPLLKDKTDGEKWDYILQTLTQREKYYSKARLIVDGLSLKSSELEAMIREIL